MKIVMGPRGTYVAEFKRREGGVRTQDLYVTDKKKAEKRAAAAKLEDIEINAIRRDAIVKLMGGEAIETSKAIKRWAKAQKKGGDVTERTLYNYKTMLMAWARDMRCELKPLSMIDVEHIRAYIDGRDGSKASSCRLRLTILRQFFDWAVAENLSLKNPARAIKRVKMTKMSHAQKEVTRKIAFSDDEIAAVHRFIAGEIAKLQIDYDRFDPLFRNNEQPKQLLARMRRLRFWSQAITISRWSGLRLGDICGLEWQTMSRPGCLVVFTEKRDKRVAIPLNTQLSSALSSIEKVDDTYCFPEQMKVYASKSRTALQNQFEKILNRSGVKGKSFHCLRCAASQDMAKRFMDAGHSEDVAKRLTADLLGHSNVNTTEIYLQAKEQSDDPETPWIK